MYEPLGVTISLAGGPGTQASLPEHNSLLTKTGTLLCTSMSSPQLVCGLQGGGSELNKRALYMHACKCQLFTDEGSHRLPKCLNYSFSVLASATN